MDTTVASSEALEERHQFKEDVFQKKHFMKVPYRSYVSMAPVVRLLEEKQKSGDGGERWLANTLLQEIENVPELKGPIKDPEKLMAKYPDLMEMLLLVLVPPAHRETQYIKVTPPFGMDKGFGTPAFHKLVGKGQVEYMIKGPTDMFYSTIMIRPASLILNKFYGQKLAIEPPISFTIKLPDQPFARNYKIHMDLRFVDIVALKEPPELSQDQINQLLSNIYDTELWLRRLPPDTFEFHGMVLTSLIDITEEEALSQLKFTLLERSAVVDPDTIGKLEHLTRLYLDIPDLRLGLTAIDYPVENSVAHKYKIRFDFLAEQQEHLLADANRNSIYEKACKYKEMVLVEDLQKASKPTPIEQGLIEKGIRSIIVAPLFSKNKDVIGLLEIGSPRPYELHSFTEFKFQELTGLFSMAVERSREEIDNSIEAIIREQFTAVHPSVEWKFIETSYNLMDCREKGETNPTMDPIVFNDVYPLYGQADIVSSSMQRNRSIRADLLDNLQRARKVIGKALEVISFPLLDQFRLKVDRCIAGLEMEFNSNDETIIVDMLQDEIHPLLLNLQPRYPELAGHITAYFNNLDPELGIIYRERKNFEDSVTQLNTAVANYLDQQQLKWQQIMPHYFEKYKTDGVEYDLYVGQSLLRNDQFCTMHLHNFRLWQLIDMCEITRLVANLREDLPVPLTTAQMIFAYTNTLSIRFRMDEKQFDVDGAYNVRYEILKKRIDKALIEGTDERLTQSGKVAIVYLQEKDKQEYLDYIDYLQHEGYITGEVEDLTLGKLQGVQGLRALRVTVANGPKP